MAGLTFNKGDVINGRFEVHGILGKGGFGEVYLVYDLTVREVYALKTIGSEYLADPTSKQAFKKEALLWVNLDEHPPPMRHQVALYFSAKTKKKMALVGFARRNLSDAPSRCSASCS